MNQQNNENIKKEPAYKKSSVKKSLREKVLRLLALVLFCPVIIIASIIITVNKNTLYKFLFNQQKETARKIADVTLNYIDSARIIANNILTVVEMEKKTVERVKIMKNLLHTNKNIIEAILLSTNGSEIVRIATEQDRIVTVKKLINRINMQEFLDAVNYKKTISRLYFTDKHEPYIFISIRKNDLVFMIKLSLKNLNPLLYTKDSEPREYSFIVDEKGILIAHPDPGRVEAHTNFSGLPVVSDFIKGKEISSWRVYKSEEGYDVVSVYYPLKKDNDEINWAVVTQKPVTSVTGPVKNMILQVILFSIIFTVIFFILGYRFINGLLNPLAKLRNAAISLSRGKFDIYVEINSGDEIEELAQTFNLMVKSLKELEELRQDLISMIIHDMKSPLSGITGGLDYLSKCEPGSNEYNQIIEIIKSSSSSLLAIVQNIVDISRMEDGKLKLNLESVDIREVFRDITGQFDVLTKSESKELIVEYDSSLPLIKIDRMLIVRVMNNLLTNALHHTTTGGKIWLKVMLKDKNSIKITVADNGVGIPPEYRDKIFEKFVQVERKRARLRTGTGLGLTFCKMAIELHGGNIWVESEEGKGSAFIFVLPVEPPSEVSGNS